MKDWGFASGGSYNGRATDFNGERAVNLYPEIAAPSEHAKARIVLQRVPGKKLFSTLPKNVRGIFSTDSRLFAAGGTKFYEIYQDGSQVEYTGDIGPGSTPVEWFDNGRMAFIVSGNQAHYDFGSPGPGIPPTLVRAAFNDGTPLDVVQGGYVDGYFLAQERDSNRFFISGSNADLTGTKGPTTWDPLDKGEKAGSPDRLFALFAARREIWLMGQKTTEVWNNTGAANFPFQPIPGVFIEEGIAAPYSIAEIGGFRHWLGADSKGSGVVFRAEAYTPQRISTHAMEQKIQTYYLFDAVGRGHQQEGHSFFVLSFPTSKATWVWDNTTEQWHERAYWDPQRALYLEDRARFGAYVLGWNQYLVADGNSGKIYDLSPAHMDDDGVPIRRLRSSPHVNNEGKKLFYKAMQLDMTVGQEVNLLDGMGLPRDPMMMRRTSNDGGKTWNNERVASIGKTGKYKMRVRWRRDGSAYDRAYETVCTEPINECIVDAYLDVVVPKSPPLPGAGEV